MHVAFISPSGEIGGAERSLLLLLERLDRRRVAPIVYAGFPGPLLEECAGIDVPAVVVPMGAAGRLSRFGPVGTRGLVAGASGMAAATVRVARAVRKDGVQLIHTNGIKAHLIGGVCGRLLGLPVVWHVRDLVQEGKAATAFRIAADRLPRRIIAISQSVAEQFSGRRAASVTRMIHNAVDLERFRPSRPSTAVREALGFGAETAILAMVAHFTPWKGHLVFLEVLARLRASGAPVAGLIIGASIYTGGEQDTYEREVRARCQEMGLSQYVHFAGYQRSVADLLAACDILVHPPTRPEPFGRVLIEAMALEKPVVAAAAGGIPEIVEPGVTGVLVPPGDAEATASALLPLLRDEALRKRMGRQGRERVERAFHPAAHALAVERVYEEIW